jgi:hypothetical protein
MSTSYNPKVVTDGLVQYFDASNPKSFVSGSRITTDLISTTRTGSLVAGVTGSYTTVGEFTFNNTGYISANTIVTNVSDWTLAAWVKPAAANASSTFISNGRQGVNTGSGFALMQNIGSSSDENPDPGLIGGNRFTILYCDRRWVGALNTPELVIGGWQYLVASCTASVVTAYFNGVRYGSYTGTSPIAPVTTDNITFGAQQTQNIRYLSGSLGPIQIYNRGLSATEVLQNFNATRGRFGV